jgi:hypothetical protein
MACFRKQNASRRGTRSQISIVVQLTAMYIADTVVQWRTPQGRSKKYLVIQLFIIVAFFVAEVVLVILSLENLKEVRQAMLYCLQGLSLLQSLIIEVRVLIWESITADQRNRP